MEQKFYNNIITNYNQSIQNQGKLYNEDKMIEACMRGDTKELFQITGRELFRLVQFSKSEKRLRDINSLSKLINQWLKNKCYQINVELLNKRQKEDHNRIVREINEKQRRRYESKFTTKVKRMMSRPFRRTTRKSRRSRSKSK